MKIMPLRHEQRVWTRHDEPRVHDVRLQYRVEAHLRACNDHLGVHVTQRVHAKEEARDVEPGAAKHGESRQANRVGLQRRTHVVKAVGQHVAAKDLRCALQRQRPHRPRRVEAAEVVEAVLVEGGHVLDARIPVYEECAAVSGRRGLTAGVNLVPAVAAVVDPCGTIAGPSIVASDEVSRAGAAFGDVKDGVVAARSTRAVVGVSGEDGRGVEDYLRDGGGEVLEEEEGQRCPSAVHLCCAADVGFET